MKILWHSNAPWTPTGYGQQTAMFTPLLAQEHEVAISSFYGLDGSPLRWQGIPVLPGITGEFGNDSIIEHAENVFNGDLRGGLVLTLMDVWVLDPKKFEQLNVACWVPVDHEPAPPPVIRFFIESGAVPIAMSRYGQRMLGRLDPLYVPHGVDTSVYKPKDRDAIRKKAGFPDDAFLIGMVAANKGRPGRKGFNQAIQAVAEFQREYENTFLYLHTVMSPGPGQGEDLMALLAACDFPLENLRVADQYQMMYNPYTHDEMASLYSSFDVLLNPSMGEGFGITPLEAQACGTPCIVTNHSAMTEVCGAGWHVGGERFWTGMRAWQSMPHVAEIVAALEDLHSTSRKGVEALRTDARAHALTYDTDLVFREYWLPALKVVEDRFAKQTPVRIPARLPRVAA